MRLLNFIFGLTTLSNILGLMLVDPKPANAGCEWVEAVSKNSYYTCPLNQVMSRSICHRENKVVRIFCPSNANFANYVLYADAHAYYGAFFERKTAENAEIESNLILYRQCRNWQSVLYDHSPGFDNICKEKIVRQSKRGFNSRGRTPSWFNAESPFGLTWQTISDSKIFPPEFRDASNAWLNRWIF